MKVLLSAYACEPNKGSEPGVGWNWALEIARLGHDVWVITRANNQSTIESEQELLSQLPNLHFIYYDVPKWIRWWKKGSRGVHLYYLFWQIGAYLKAKESHKSIIFDLVHHITFVSIRQPSFMGNLEIPFIFGPVAGGDRAPWRLRNGYGIRGWSVSLLRDLANFAVRFDPMMRRTFRQADRIFVTSQQTKNLLPKKYKEKSVISLAIGIDKNWSTQPKNLKTHTQVSFSPRILYVGNLLYLKGMHLGIPAFQKILTYIPDATLTVIGSGPDERRWRKLANKCKTSKQINWFPKVQQNELRNFYSEHDIFLFPSLQDSGGMVVLEALAHGLPVVCLDIGGPSIIVNENCGEIVETKGKRESDVILSLANAMKSVSSNSGYHTQISFGAKSRSKEFVWSEVAKNIYCSDLIEMEKLPVKLVKPVE